MHRPAMSQAIFEDRFDVLGQNDLPVKHKRVSTLISSKLCSPRKMGMSETLLPSCSLDAVQEAWEISGSCNVQARDVTDMTHVLLYLMVSLTSIVEHMRILIVLGEANSQKGPATFLGGKSWWLQLEKRQQR